MKLSCPGIGGRPLHERSSNRIRPVQHNHLYACLRGRLQKISQGSFVGIKPRPRILNVEHNGVQCAQDFRLRSPRGIRTSIHAVHRNAGRRIFGIVDVGSVQRSSHPVLRAEDRIQRNSRSRRQHINRSLPRSVDASLIRHQPNVLLPFSRLQHIEPVLLEHIDPVLHRSITRAHAPLRAHGLVVSRDALPPQRFLLLHRQRQSRRNFRGHLHPQPDRIALPPRMHRIGQQNDVRLRRRIDPDRCPREPRMPERPHRQEDRRGSTKTANQYPTQTRAARAPMEAAPAALIFFTVSDDRIPSPPFSSACANFARSSPVENNPACPATPPMRCDRGSCTTPRIMCSCSSYCVGAIFGFHAAGGRNRVCIILSG